MLFIVQLAEQVISPKDDLARQLKEAKRRSKQKVDDHERQELEESAPISEVADDGTLPMPEEEMGEPSEAKPEEGEEEVEESKLKRLKKKDKTEESKLFYA